MKQGSEGAVRSLLIALDVEGREVLVVGAGSVGARKAARLLEAGAKVVVVSSAPASSRMQALASARDELELITRAFDASDIEGKALVFAATDDPALNAQIVSLAKASGVHVNSATSSTRGSASASAKADFTLLARVDHDASAWLDVGVHTAGGSPVLSAALSRRLGAWLDDEEVIWGVLAPVFAELRPAVFAGCEDGRVRGQFWRALLARCLEREEGEGGWRTDRVHLREVICEVARAHGIRLGEGEVEELLSRAGVV